MTELLEAAISIREHAYAPYSNFKVGAAVRTEGGRIFSGCNVENAAYPLGQCAEANAIAAMVASGEKSITDIVIVGDGEEPCTPCGGCRQRLAEFAPKSAEIAIYRLRKKQLETTLAKLLPHAFGPSNLGVNSSRGTDSKDAELNSAAEELQPKIAVILGSGLGSFVDDLEIHKTFSFDELDGFPQPTVTGHLGRMMIGRLRSAPIIVLQGRVHLYEGHSASTINTVIRRIAELGCSVLIVTNAAGGIRTDFTPGHIALIDDHINAMGTSPLIGPNNDAIGPRFPDMSDTYSARLREISRVAAANIGIPLDSGVYLATVGPAFETPAEVRAFRALGADMVGMSTVPEVISARHVGMEVLGFSIITNLAAGLGSGQLSHEETLQHADRAAGNVRLLLGSVIPAIKLA